MIIARLHRICLYTYTHYTVYLHIFRLPQQIYHGGLMTLFVLASTLGQYFLSLYWKMCFIRWKLGVSHVLSSNLVSGLCSF